MAVSYLLYLMDSSATAIALLGLLELLPSLRPKPLPLSALPNFVHCTDIITVWFVHSIPSVTTFSQASPFPYSIGISKRIRYFIASNLIHCYISNFQLRDEYAALLANASFSIGCVKPSPVRLPLNYLYFLHLHFS